MKLLLAGDVHGNNGWWARLMEYATKFGCDTIVQLGDFGYWEHTPEGRLYLDKVSRKAVRAHKLVYFIDGNHENHPMLWSNYPPDASGFCEVRENLHYIPRGHSWEWDGRKFLALGGAYSVDVGWRLEEEALRSGPRTLWWPTETITGEDRDNAIAAGKVDVMFSHDCPWGVDLPGIGGDFPESDLNRALLREVVCKTRPELLVHGHYHMRTSEKLALPYEEDGELKWHETQVEGLAHDGAWDHTAWTTLEWQPIGYELASTLTRV
jgi:Icc-related predicted phosphoesterase